MELFETSASVILEYKTICTLFVVLCLLYYHFTSTFTFFKDRGIPYRTPTIFFGNIWERVIMKTNFREFNLKLYRDFIGKPYAGYFEGRRPILMIRDPDLIKTILVKDFHHFTDRVGLTPNEPNYINRFVMNLKGGEWRAVRSILTPCFSSARLHALVPYVDKCILNMLKQIDVKIKDDPEVEVKTLMNHFTLDTIGSCAFGIDCSKSKTGEPDFIKIAEQYTTLPAMKQFYILCMLLLMSDYAKYLVLSFWNLKALSELRDILIAVRNIRRKDPASRRNDFLQSFLDSSDQEKAEAAKSPSQQRHLDDDTIDGQSLQFVLAGYETTSNVLSFTIHLLALHPEVQTKLRNEIKQVAARHNGEINYDSIGEMCYLEAVLFESMRIYPPLSIIDRRCVKKYTVPGTNVTLMPGHCLLVPIIGLHLDPQFFPEPEKFKPDRFSDEAKGTRPPHVYLPFGTGPRNCIGLRFATVQSKLAIAKLIVEFEVAPGSKTQVPIPLCKEGVLLKPKQGIWVRVSRVSLQ